MCYWVGTNRVREEIKKKYERNISDEIIQLFYTEFIENKNNDFKSHYVAIGKARPELTVILKEEGDLHFKNMIWTLPFSYRNPTSGIEIKRELLNSTCENVFFQHKNIIYTQRCLIPINGYFEYFHYRNETFPFYIYPSDDGIFYAGGIWEKFKNEDTNENYYAFSIITTPPNNLIRKIHNNSKSPNGSRMLLLMNSENANQFLNETLNKPDIMQFFHSYDEARMRAHSVIRFQRKEFINCLSTPKVQEFHPYPELSHIFNEL